MKWRRFKYLEAHLHCEDQFVFLKQAPSGVRVHGVGYAVYEIDHTTLQVLCRLGSVNGFLKHHTERL